jgi:hypothetical protein
MKSHNTKLCAGPHKHSHAYVPRQTNSTKGRRSATATSNGSADNVGASVESVDELTDLLHQLQDEFGVLNW